MNMKNRRTTHNKQFGKMAGSVLFLEAKVLNRSSGIFSNFGAEKPPLRQAAGRCTRFYDKHYA
jgi:hypothetical protein